MSRWSPLGFALAVLALWELASRTVIDPYFLPTPSAIIARAVTSLPTMLPYFAVTLGEALLGALIGAAVAIPLGYAIAKSRTVARTIEPYTAMSQAIPAVAIAPVLALWLGYGTAPILALCAVMVFFPISLTTTYGLGHIDPDVIAAARLDGAHGWSLLRSIEFPLALPAILTGLRNGLTLAMTGAVVGEFVIGGNGLGQLLTAQQRNNDTEGLFATVAALAVVAIAMYGAVRAVESMVEERL